MRYDRDSDERPPLPGAGYMEDYTLPFLVVAGVLCYIVLFALWAVFGFPFTATVALLTDRLLLAR